MISLEDARARIFADIGVLAPEAVPLAEALGLVLAETVVAGEAVPPFANTAMDGFAVRSTDTRGASEAAPVRLSVAGTVAAGQVSDRALGRGEAIRIMTGAPIPDGADAVVMVELTRSEGAEVDVLAEVPPGNHIRPAGDDLEPGTEVFTAGTTLGPGHLGVLASLGVEAPLVHRRPRVGVLSTGDELVVGAAPLAPGQIRDSNRVTLLSLVREAGAEPIDLGLVRDDEAAVAAALTTAAARCDVLLTSGGVSMGDFDYVKAFLERQGRLNWMQVAIRPAKPLAFGVLDGTPVFGLPGNPVSSMVSFELFARPSLLRLMGRRDTERPQLSALAAEPLVRRPDGKVHFVRVIASQDPDGPWRVRSAGGQGSHQLAAMATANALAVVPDGDGVPTGGRVRVLLLR
jgi:molybdopterin molybdotransferase